MTARNLGSIVKTVIANARAKMPRKALQSAHEAAAEFHEAMADAFEAETEIEDATAELRRTPDDGLYLDILKRYQARYQEAIGKAGVALQKMPTRRSAVLEIELEATLVTSTVIPMKAAE